ncbi:MAG: sugar phosphate isomerase/epimerase [Lachnospiraceae bacterium]|nr:sugar phosphate isomerase/epimerase [Lachnospiraceae bacterium]
MKLGCCLNMLGNGEEPIGRAFIETAQKAGYDYVELPLAQVMELDRQEFDGLLAQLGESGICCRACNNFFPAAVRLTGEDVCPEKVKDYIKKAVERASRLGAGVIVFGSSGAKNVPEGFDHGRAREQIADVLRWADACTGAAGIRIAIEPLNRKESNIILSLTEGEELRRMAGVPSVRLLVDYYHFSMEKEEMETLRRWMPQIAHVHFAEPQGRRFPERKKEDYGDFFQTLRDGGYDGLVSVEAYAKEPEQALRQAVFLREYFA